MSGDGKQKGKLGGNKDITPAEQGEAALPCSQSVEKSDPIETSILCGRPQAPTDFKQFPGSDIDREHCYSSVVHHSFYITRFCS